MSYDLNVRLRRCDMPTPAAWASAIIAADFPVALDTDFDVDTDMGFLPCVAKGEASGFECAVSEHGAKGTQESGIAPGHDFRVCFSMGASPLELVCGFAAASVLASMTGGTLDDPHTGESIACGHATSWAKKRLVALSTADDEPAPEQRHYWFRAKRYGWGWGLPLVWQGWAVLGIYLLLVAVGAAVLLPWYGPEVFFPFIVVMMALLVGTCWVTGEPPHWRWRKQRHDGGR